MFLDSRLQIDLRISERLKTSRAFRQQTSSIGR
jgi:hypothetical protein